VSHPTLLNYNKVLDSNTEKAWKIDARLNCNHHSWAKLFCAGYGKSGFLVDCKAYPMAQSMSEIVSVARFLYDSSGNAVDFLTRLPRSNGFQRRFLGTEDNIINPALQRSGLTQRNSAGHVSSVPVINCTEIQHYKVTLGKFLIGCNSVGHGATRP